MLTQQNFNDFNKNREYPFIDRKIKESFVKESSAQKTKVYDMYTRFYRWAMDRIDSQGIVSFITNRSFIEAYSYDGFRKCIETDFDYAYIVDTRSDVRKNGKIAGTTHNIFGIQTGVAMMFLIKNNNCNSKCDIKYFSLKDEMLKQVKLNWLRDNNYESIRFAKINPDKNNNWLNIVNNDFDTLIPLYDKKENSIFNFSSLGVSTNRNDWVTDISEQNLIKKVKYFTDKYNSSVKLETMDESIKWSRDLEKKSKRNIFTSYNINNCIEMEYRPFSSFKYYSEKVFSDMLTQNHYDMFGVNLNNDNVIINYNKRENNNSSLVSNKISDLHFIGDTQCFPRFLHDSENEKIDNISDWGLFLFKKKYKDDSITKNDIFYYIYAVLNSNIYKDTYEINLSRELPKIPFYSSFWNMSKNGKLLLDLHLNYHNATPYKRSIVDELSKANKKQKHMIFEDNNQGLMNKSYGEIKVLLKVDKKLNKIFIDKQITLENIPTEAWEYKIANRSAIEWVLDQNKYKKSKSPYINEHFNDYNFSKRRNDVINLIEKICRLSVDSLEIIQQIDGETI